MAEGSRAARIIDVQAPPFSIIFFTLAPNTSLTIESSNCSAGADPVFHLANASDADDSHFGGPWWVHDDNSAGGVNARVTRSPSTSSRRFALIVRAANNTSSGLCNLIRNGAPWLPLVMVGGHFVNAADVTKTSSTLMYSQLLPGGSVLPAVATLASNNLGLTTLGLGNGAAGSSVVLPTYAEPRFMVGTPWVADELVWTTPRSGAARLLVNGGLDNDIDGLGHLLENELLTCPEPTCPNAHHGSDTDRDGLTDSQEVLGIAGQLPDGSDDIALSRWGAHPLQKDAFVEVDHIADLGPPNAFGENPFQRMRLNNESVEDWVDEVLNVFVPTTDQNHLKNPRGGAAPDTRSLRVHLDLGVAPLVAADEWKFGDYGGASRRSLEREVWIHVTGPVDWFAIEINGGTALGGVATGLSLYETAVLFRNVALQMDAPDGPFTVRPLFTLPNVPGYFIALKQTTVGVPFEVELLFAGASGAAVIPENLESIRSHYELDYTQVDAIRRGKFRYAVIHLPNEGQASGARFISQLASRTFAHEFGHTLGMEHWGHDAWGASGIECIPHYLGLMRYGDDIYLRLNELDNVTFNPAQAFEFSPFGALPNAFQNIIQPGNYSFMAGMPWIYQTFTPPWPVSTVDLNRDGASGPAGTWRTMALTLFDAQCISMSQGAQVVASTSAVSGGVDLLQFDGRLYAFWATGSEVRYRSAALGAVGNKSCTGSSSPYSGSPCLTWGTTRVLPGTNPARGVTAQVFAGELFVAYHDPSSQLVIRRYVKTGTDTLNHQATWSFGATTNDRTDHTPELFVSHNLGPGTLTVAYLAQSTRVRQRVYNPTSMDWNTTGSLAGHDNRPALPPPAPPPAAPTVLFGSQPPVMVTWPTPTNPGVPEALDSIRRTYALIPDTQGALRFYRFQSGTHVWERIRSFDERTHAKPFLEFRYLRTGTGQLRQTSGIDTFGGHFLFGYHDLRDGGTAARFIQSAYVDRNNPSPGPWVDPIPWRIEFSGVRDFIHNEWSLDIIGTSMSLYTDRTIDNVFGLIARDEEVDSVRFLPHADGSPNHPYLVRSDYRTLEDMVCWRLREAVGVPEADATCGVPNVQD